MPSSSPPTEKKPRKPSLQCQYQPRNREAKQASTAVTTILHDDKGEDAIRVPSDEYYSPRTDSQKEKRKKKKKSLCHRIGSCIGRSCQDYGEYMAADQSRQFSMYY
ncbi:hypothetical protein TWF696_006502 [Orbilia brochopaga]|uniref:Uncharacterized protein n=1 Tax=Orbilia brochopaga TaxID=3140254 RepID=A0AAV9UXV9_9PEZI